MLAKNMYLLYNEHKKKTTSRRLVILARWLTHYFRDNRLCLDAEGGYFFLYIKKTLFLMPVSKEKEFLFYAVLPIISKNNL